jgi:CheY-like chemotaxis protein
MNMMITKKKILITDDDSLSRKLAETLLLSNGYDVYCADCGHAALEAVAQCMPDLILLDLMMPGMDGFDVLRCLKAEPLTVGIPVIMVTALDDTASQARLQAAGVSTILTKPLDRWLLQASVANMLGESHDTN